MKCFVILTLFALTLPAMAREGQLLKCLGAEEKEFHLKKDTGPLYDLNQRLIAEMIQIPNADVGGEDLKHICSKSGLSPSWKLLEASIQKGKELFVMDPNTPGMQAQMTKGMIDDYIEATKEILLNFISAIQTLSPTPDCLKEEIPELDKFFTDIKYLQEDVDIKAIFKGRDLKIFEQLKGYRSAFKKCQSRAALKKKPKSSSVEAPKKS